MHAGSSSSLSLSEKIKKRPSPANPSPSPSPPKDVVPRRKGFARIEESRKRMETHKTWSDSIIDKAQKYNSLTDAHVAAITFNPKDELCFFGSPSIEEVYSMYLRKKYDPKLLVSPEEWIDWAKKERDSCETKEQCTTLIMKYGAALSHLCKKFKELENNPTGNASAGRDSSLDFDDMDWAELLGEPIIQNALWGSVDGSGNSVI